MTAPALSAWDNQAVSDWHLCPFFYYLRHERDWVPEGKTQALSFGTCWGAAMDAFWGPASTTPAYAIEAMQAAFKTAWVAEGLPLGVDLLAQEADSKGRTIENAFKMIEAYVVETWVAKDRYELVEIEKQIVPEQC